MLVDSSVRFFCAELITPSRSWSLAIESRWSSAPLRSRSHADPMGHAVEPLVDGAGELAVTGDAELGQASAPPLQPEAGVALARLPPPAAHMQGDYGHQHDQGEDHEPEQPNRIIRGSSE